MMANFIPTKDHDFDGAASMMGGLALNLSPTMTTMKAWMRMATRTTMQGFICFQAPFCLLLFVLFVSLVAKGTRNTNNNKQLQTTTATMENFIPTKDHVLDGAASMMGGLVLNLSPTTATIKAWMMMVTRATRWGFICFQAPFCLLLFVFFVSLVAKGTRNTNNSKNNNNNSNDGKLYSHKGPCFGWRDFHDGWFGIEFVSNDGDNDGLDEDGDKNNNAGFHLLPSTLLLVVVCVLCFFGCQRNKEHKQQQEQQQQQQ